VSLDEPVVIALEQACLSVLQSRPPYYVQEAWCETDFLINDAGIPTVNFGPGQMAVAHSSKEFIAIDQVQQAVQIYAVLMLLLLSDHS
jgi:acetylornithine deacetylase/succinyl-diaminopimelate desuccinylase